MNDKGTILIVDDTPADLELLVDTLTAQGYQVQSVESGDLVLASVAARPPELILLDIQMPGLDGFEVCRRLKARTESRDIPIMLVSVSGESAERVEGLKLGAVDYITKPFDREELLARVHTHLELGRLRVRLERQAVDLRQANAQLQSELAERRRAELEIQRQAAFPRYNPNPVLALSAAGEINYFNDAAGEMARALGLENPAQMLPPNTRAMVRECLAAGRSKLRVETPIGQRVISWSFFPVKDDNTVHCYAGDITERKRKEEELRASQQIIEGILNAIPVRVFWKDKSLVYLGCNAAFARDGGFADPKDIIGKDDYQMGWRDQAELYRGDDRQVIETGCAKLLIEESQTTPEGNTITLLSSKIPLRGSKGEVTGVLGTYMDITERKQAEEVLEQRVKLQDQLARTAASVPGMIYSLLLRPDGSTRLPYASGTLSEIFDLQLKDVIKDAAPIFSLIHPDDLAHVQTTIAESARTLNPWRDEFRVRHNRLGEIWVEGHSVPQREPDGGTLWHGFIQDITERKKAEADLAERARLSALAAEVGSALTNNSALHDSLQGCAAALVQHLDAAFARVWTLNAQTNVLELQASAGLYTHLDGPHGRVPVGKFKIGLIAQERKPHLTNHVLGDPRVGDQEWAKREGMVSFAGYPLVVDNRLLGVMALFARHPLPDPTLRTMAGIADNIALGIQRMHTDVALRQSEARMRLQTAALESAANGVVITDVKGTIQWVNPAFTELTGYSAEEAIGQNPRVLKSGEHPDSFYQDLWQTISSGRVWKGELINRRKDGQLYGEEMTITPVRDAEGAVSQFVAIKQDVTERKRVTEALRQSEEQFRAMFDLASVGIAQADPHTAQWLRVNKKMCEITGYSAGELLQMRVPDITYPEDRQLDREAFERVVRGEAPDYRMEKRYIRRDGTLAWVNVNMTIIRDAAGQPTRTMAAIEDITVRKQAEDELREKEQLLSEAQRLGHIGSWLFDLTGSMRWSGELYRIYGVSPDTFTPTEESLLGLIYPDDRPAMRAWMAACAAGEKPGESEFRICLPDGTIRWIRGHGDAVHDAGNRLTHIAGTAQDITERKAAEARLAGLQKQLLDASREAGMAEIATNVLHNVGNVLNSVNISTGLVVESVRKSRASSLARVVVLLRDHVHDLGEFITQDSRGKHLPAHLAQLSEHLLAEQETNVRELDSLRRNVEHIKEIVAMQQNYASFGGVKEMVNVAELVEDSLRLNEGALSRHDVEVIREFKTVPPLNLEKHKFLQIMVNLLRNAKHACQDSERADKRLTVRVANGEGWIRISVIDNGIGIPSENLTRIFNHGFTTRKGGHGFGLHSGALAAKEMGGSLTVHSDGPGQGASFTLELPVPDAGEHSHE